MRTAIGRSGSLLKFLGLSMGNARCFCMHLIFSLSPCFTSVVGTVDAHRSEVRTEFDAFEVIGWTQVEFFLENLLYP